MGDLDTLVISVGEVVRREGEMEFCVNGDGNKVCPPSEVLCSECMDKITKNLEDIIASFDTTAEDSKE